MIFVDIGMAAALMLGAYRGYKRGDVDQAMRDVAIACVFLRFASMR